MKALVTAGIILASTSAIAAELDWSASLGAERSTETEVNSLYGSVGLNNITIGTTFVDTAADQASFNVSKYEIDIVQPIGDYVSLYMKNDFDDDMKHSDTVVGTKITF